MTGSGWLALGAKVAALVGLALAARWVVDPLLGDHLPFVTFFVAVAAAAWVGNGRAALLATVLGFLAATYFFVPPRFGFYGDTLTTQHAVGLLTYFMVCLAFVGFGEAMWRARRRAEQQRETLEITLASIGDGVITTDVDGCVTSVNAIAASLTGWSNDAAKGRPLEEIFHIVNETTRNTVENPTMRALQSGTIVGLANRTVLIARNGEERPIDDSAAPITNASGSVIGCVLVFRDIAERRAAERALDLSEKRKGAVLEAALDAIVSMDQSGGIVDFNPAAERMFGHARDAVLGKDMADIIIPPAYRAAHRHGLARYLATGKAVVLNRRIELSAVRSDGSEFPVELSITPVAVEDGLMFTGYLRDISERKLAEALRVEYQEKLEREIALRTKALTKSNRFMEAVLESVDDAIVACDADGVLTLFNESTRKVHGLPAEGLPPEAWAEHYSLQRPDGSPMPTEEIPLRRAHRGELVRDAEMVIAPKAQPKRTLLASGRAFFDSHGVKIGAVVSMHDVTERKEAEAVMRMAKETLERGIAERTKELSDTNEMLQGEIAHRQRAEEGQELLVRELAHRVKNILASVQAIAQQSLKGAPDGVVAGFTARLGALSRCHDLLIASRWQGAQFRDLMQSIFAPYGVEGRVHLKGDDFTLSPGDAQTLVLAIHELTTNAAKHGALSTAAGEISAIWTCSKDPACIELHWVERGGPSISEPAREGFGTRLLKSLASQSGASFSADFTAQGFECRLRLPLK